MNLSFSKFCTELVFSSLTKNTTKGPGRTELHGKWGERKYWDLSAGKTLPLSSHPVFGSSPVPISLLPLGIANGCHLLFMPAYCPTYACFSHFEESCCLEQLFSFQAQPPFPAEGVTALMLGGDALVGKLSCPKTCQAAQCLDNLSLPISTTGSCQGVSALFPLAIMCQKWTMHIFKVLNPSGFRRCYTKFLCTSLYNIYLCFLFRKSVAVFFPSHIWKVKQSMVWLQTLHTLPPLKAAFLS